jgi:hypothetical protein
MRRPILLHSVAPPLFINFNRFIFASIPSAVHIEMVRKGGKATENTPKDPEMQETIGLTTEERLVKRPSHDEPGDSDKDSVKSVGETQCRKHDDVDVATPTSSSLMTDFYISQHNIADKSLI